MKTLLLLAFPLFLTAQSPHSVTLTWKAPADATAASTYNVYRATGLCSGTPTFSKIATAVAALTFVDGTVTPGNYCYTVTQVQAGAESAQATPVNPAVLPQAVASLSFTVQ